MSTKQTKQKEERKRNEMFSRLLTFHAKNYPFYLFGQCVDMGIMEFRDVLNYIVSPKNHEGPIKEFLDKYHLLEFYKTMCNVSNTYYTLSTIIDNFDKTGEITDNAQEYLKKIKIKGPNDYLCGAYKIKTKKLLLDFVHACPNNIDLNWINVSLLKDLSFVFANLIGNHDVRFWNVSNAYHMNGVFYHYKGNVDLSRWKIMTQCEIYSIFDYSDISQHNMPYWINGNRMNRENIAILNDHSIIDDEIIETNDILIDSNDIIPDDCMANDIEHQVIETNEQLDEHNDESQEDLKIRNEYD